MQISALLVSGLLTVGALSAGCAAPAQIDGFSVYKEGADQDFTKVRQRASFELSCPADKLKLTILNVTQGGTLGDHASQIGVEGCEKKAVYVHAPDNSWLVNSTAPAE